jgi:outer membrane protein assembly factor BamE (lipoprotein component of BamABCDE complex)
MRLRFVAPLALALVAAASAAVAGQITAEQVAALKVGEATYDQVVGQFGKPTTVETSSDGSRTISYVTTHTHVKATSFVPVVGLFAGGAKGSTAVERLEFDKDGKLVKTYTRETNVECHTFGGCGTK